MLYETQFNKGKQKLKSEVKQGKKALLALFGLVWLCVVLWLLSQIVVLAADFVKPNDKPSPEQELKEEVKKLQEQLEDIHQEVKVLGIRREERKKIQETVTVAKVEPSRPKPVPVQPVQQPVGVKEIAHRITVAHFGEANWPSMDRLIQKESGYRVSVVNKSSGACGLAQFLPCNKFGTGAMNLKSPEEQLTKMAEYIRNRYGNPNNAWNFHLRNNWY